jgi:hypothetical protein
MPELAKYRLAALCCGIASLCGTTGLALAQEPTENLLALGQTVSKSIAEGGQPDRHEGFQHPHPGHLV